MRNKIKQLLKKEDGFTLVELLGVIVILGIILAIAVPSIGNVIEGAREDSKDAQIELVLDAAELYAIQKKEKDVNEIPLADLVKDNYLKQADLDKMKEEFGITIETGTKVGDIVPTPAVPGT